MRLTRRQPTHHAAILPDHVHGLVNDEARHPRWDDGLRTNRVGTTAFRQTQWPALCRPER